MLSHNGATVETVEHLLAAITSMGLDNAVVELDHREVPVMDGSSAPFVYLIQEAGLKTLATPRRYLKVLRPITAVARRQADLALPVGLLQGHLQHQLRSPAAAAPVAHAAGDEASFVDDIAPARTFGFLHEVELLRQQGLAQGGSLENAIVLSETGVLNNQLRYEDEFVRHKILDAIGDLSLVGYPIIGHLVAHRAGHALHTAFAKRVLEDADAWKLVELAPEPAAALAAAAVPVKA